MGAERGKVEGGMAAAGSRQPEDAAQLSARFGHSEASDAATGVH